jgi:hypothetical protein
MAHAASRLLLVARGTNDTRTADGGRRTADRHHHQRRASSTQFRNINTLRVHLDRYDNLHHQGN